MNGASLNYPFCLEDHPRTCKWLGSPPSISYLIRPFGRERLPYLGDLLTVVINHLLNWDDSPRGGIKQCKFMVILMDFHCNSALFGLVSFIMTPVLVVNKKTQDGAKRRQGNRKVKTLV